MKVLYFSQIGKRSVQQDHIWFSEDRGLFVVCDGVGGKGDGKKASRLVIDFFKNLDFNVEEGNFIDSFPKRMNDLTEKLRRHSAIQQKSLSTTLALTYVINNTAWIYHLGDSKIFVLSKKRGTFWVSKDHSLVQDLYEIGALTSEDEMRKHPLRNQITKALSSEQILEESEYHIKDKLSIETGDLIFLCTDGVLENYSIQTLAEKFLNSKTNPEHTFKEIQDTCAQYSKDNNSCILIIY